ncbi:hypothetical protein GCM10008939_03260 [Deinococcus aquiradiocola]|uniref:Uncharacterized protein n=1 Tax=Deinococcus aquiradiocola TaxID=393059 RepID=A0A917UKA7_9DEIO|nr:hypothetical protein GCM10008939_03260 [Deinococcus aquiradiocola]
MPETVSPSLPGQNSALRNVCPLRSPQDRHLWWLRPGGGFAFSSVRNDPCCGARPAVSQAFRNVTGPFGGWRPGSLPPRLDV